MVYQPKNPVGYRDLMTWKQAGDIYRMAKRFTDSRLNKISDSRLVGHINDSARSVQRNIEEGYKRATTREYVEFLGFSRASLEELKGDFEELKREWIKGIRRENKGNIRAAGIRGAGGAGSYGVAGIGGARAAGIRGAGSEGVAGIRDARAAGIRGAGDGRDVVIREIEELLGLIYGEDCMMGRQIISLERKMVEEKTLPRSEMIMRVRNKAGAGDKRFWNIAAEKFGIVRSEKGHKRVDKGEENKGGENKGEENKGDESKGGESKGGENKGDESKGGESKGGENKGDESKSGE